MNRDLSLDTLRGLAILAMVISGTIAFGGDLPVWMYHAQLTNPGYIANTTPPIAWNDLVFPFFIFSMGAAIPLSLSKRLQKGKSKLRIVLDVIIRTFMLLIFGTFLEHVKPFEMSNSPSTSEWIRSLVGFILILLLFLKYPTTWKVLNIWLIRLIILAFGALLIFFTSYADGSGFDLYRSDILIVLIANNIFFGSIIWLFTQRRPLVRIAILPLLFSILIAGDLHGSWNKTILDFTPFPWIYHFDYLGYLFIMIPGTLAGDFIVRNQVNFNNAFNDTIVESEDHGSRVMLISLNIVLLVMNVLFIHLRYMIFNIISNIILISAILWVWNGISSPLKAYYKHYIELGSYTLLLAIFFEAYQGGMKEEYSTFSYFFFGTALVIFLLLTIIICYDLSLFKMPLILISMIGKNPMLAYIIANLLFIPLNHLLAISHIPVTWKLENWLGGLSGLFTALIVASISILFTRKNWFLKT